MEEHLPYHQRQAGNAQKEANKLYEEGRKRRASQRRERRQKEARASQRQAERRKRDKEIREIETLKELHAKCDELTGDHFWWYQDLLRKYPGVLEKPPSVLGAVKSDKEKRVGYSAEEIPSWLRNSEVSNNPPKNKPQEVK